MGIEGVNLNTLRYANCWEDADVLVKGLKPKPGSRILSIASAGDNSLMLLTSQPDLVVAVDISPTQLFLCELKIKAIKNLEREECACFLGHWESNDRIETYSLLRTQLSSGARAYFDQHEKQLKSGIVHQGKFEKYFQLFSQRILPLIHSAKTVQELFKEKSSTEQEEFYSEKWENRRWRLLFKLFFSRFLMGRLGRSKKFFEHVDSPVAEYIYHKAEKHLKSSVAQNNFILYYNLNGCFGPFLPPYLEKSNYNKIKSNLAALQLKKGEAQVFEKQEERFDYMNLSNIFEYMDHNTFRETAQKLIQHLAPTGKVVYWNLMVDRQLSALFPDLIKQNKMLAEELGRIDRGFFYDKLIIEEIL